MRDMLNKISIPIESNLNEFDSYFNSSLESDVKIINTIVKYIAKKKGKRLRPRLCLLSAKICGEINENTYRAASLLEILHVATLMHDDVVDDSDLRRGWPSINRIWKNKLSILVGDYLFSKALTNMADINSIESVKILADLASRLSQGEILQIEKAVNKDINEEIYFKMISDKTASLFSVSCQLGALTATDNKEQIRSLSLFGEYLGQAFQIKDDLFDIVGNMDNIGKPSGYDLKKNMLTLPLIHILSNKSSIQRSIFKIKLRFLSKKNQFDKIRELILDEGGVDYAERKLVEISNLAKQHIDIFEDSDLKESLLGVLDFNLGREI